MARKNYFPLASGLTVIGSFMMASGINQVRVQNIAIHRKPHTVLRRFAVQPRTVFSGAPCLKLSVDDYRCRGCRRPGLR